MNGRCASRTGNGVGLPTVAERGGEGFHAIHRLLGSTVEYRRLDAFELHLLDSAVICAMLGRDSTLDTGEADSGRRVRFEKTHGCECGRRLRSAHRVRGPGRC